MVCLNIDLQKLEKVTFEKKCKAIDHGSRHKMENLNLRANGKLNIPFEASR